VIDHSKATPELFAALALAQGEVENASKSSNNPHFKSKYADLAEVLNTVRPVFAKHGLSIMQSTAFNGSFVSVTTLVAHKSGGLIYSTASCVPGKTDAQGIGSATTYLRRYSLAAMAGIAQEDDDGNAAAHNGKPSPIKPEGQPTSGVWEAQDAETQAGLLKLAANIAEFIETGDATGAWELIERQALNTDEKAALWTRLDSKTRTALKKAHEQRKAA
jgi:hypothetical protein